MFGWLACTSCASPDSLAQEQSDRVNLEVTGSPERLARSAGYLDLPMATMPAWKGHVGRMELGPVERASVPRVVREVRKVGCVTSIRERPCRTPLTDVASCSQAVD